MKRNKGLTPNLKIFHLMGASNIGIHFLFLDFSGNFLGL
ncbi:hypothetical protein A33Q_1349 [Indibacter alkaliphilus LW1]|uniref:Uncharacterized protein n=1 Tax=Indibacter alkaliphilus (strain CCUG 57479 / KCTC 22604 / LW1) TaxID=1189612 RepID=S2DN97_INDAL|nr:hypothetical protein A33Q_1349 [Indibacter alkaliphilus LW1]